MATQYQLPESAAMPVPSLTGRFLALNRESRVVRAFYAAELHSGAKQLVKPTMVQSAFLAGVNRAYVHWAVKRQAERGEILAGLIPLVPPSVSKANGTMLPASITGYVPDSDVVDFVRSVGVNRVLEAAVAVEAAQ
jgi:hypothetical protein